MTIQEAANRWGVKESTIWEYIGRGYIFNLSVDNNQIILPDIPKPYVKKNLKRASTIDATIVDAIDKNLYVSYTSLGLSKEKFEERLRAIERKECIHKRNESCEDYSTNLNFTLDYDVATKHFNFTFAPTIAPRMGLVTIK